MIDILIGIVIGLIIGLIGIWKVMRNNGKPLIPNPIPAPIDRIKSYKYQK